MFLAILGFIINSMKKVGFDITITIRLQVGKKPRSNKSLNR